MSIISLKRVYEKAEKDDGKRILVDRLWPRGLTKEKAKIDLWLKDIAPSDNLRKWFNHDKEKWEEFKKRYFTELKAKKDIVGLLKSEIKKGKATLVFSAKEERCNNAAALREYIESGGR
ncbi:DUF488 family protein [Patescibacteria group bacterium]|nr:DUF488 family protein [Patescibacteria group bacterium]